MSQTHNVRGNKLKMQFLLRLGDASHARERRDLLQKSEGEYIGGEDIIKCTHVSFSFFASETVRCF